MKFIERSLYPYAKLVASCFGIGFIKFAPGTMGSLAACLPLYWLAQLSILTQSIICISTYLIGSYSTSIIQSVDKTQDPSWIVIDELCAVWLLPMLLHIDAPYSSNDIFYFIFGWILFRLFDIFKPGPIKLIDQNHTSWSVMLDDIAAVILAAICIRGGMAVMTFL